VTAIEHSRRHEDPEGVHSSFDVELIARRAVEGATAVRPDLGPDPVRAQESERAPRCGTAPEIQMERPLSPGTQVQAARGVEEPGELSPAIALTRRRDLRELLADVLGGPHSDTPSSASSRRFVAEPAEP
jgi:hypothetical protein